MINQEKVNEIYLKNKAKEKTQSEKVSFCISHLENEIIAAAKNGEHMVWVTDHPFDRYDDWDILNTVKNHFIDNGFYFEEDVHGIDFELGQITIRWDEDYRDFYQKKMFEDQTNRIFDSKIEKLKNKSLLARLLW